MGKPQPKIPPVLHALVVKQAGDGHSAEQISAALWKDHRLQVTSRSVNGRMREAMQSRRRLPLADEVHLLRRLARERRRLRLPVAAPTVLRPVGRTMEDTTMGERTRMRRPPRVHLMKLDRHRNSRPVLREVAVAADSDPRTVARYVAGEKIKGLAAKRIERALRARGLSVLSGVA